MARLQDRIEANALGAFYVDTSCIDCDACRQIAPTVFGQHGGQSYVARQPGSDGETLRASMALVACPTHSIGTLEKHDVRTAAAAFPERIDGDVYYCGFCSEDSYGASSYLVRREGGNLLIDSPRAARPLLERIAQLGGVATLFLTHRDDVADHAIFRRRFGCARVLHADDRTRDTRDIERVLDGDAPIALGPGLLAIPVPGHTRGSTALLVDDKYLFTGDHLWWDHELGALDASRSVCWYSWSAQLRSLEKLLAFDFQWVLPGHGRRFFAPSPAAMRNQLEDTLRRLRADAGIGRVGRVGL
jgi:glyoxylase-like metal-dependent hydrolase (beta-lactamase superfamily II)/ferredoxin